MRRPWPVTQMAFAPPRSNDPLAIVGFHAWRLCEPVSKRRYTVVKLTSVGGTTGYGEGGLCSAADLGTAREAVAGRRATGSEFIRHRLAATPGTEAAVSNAMLDLVSRSKGIPIYQYLGGPTRFKVRLLAHPEGGDDAALTAALGRAGSHGMRAFTMAIPPREPMSRLQDWVDSVGRRIADLQRRGGEGSEWVFDGAGALTPGDAAVLAAAFEKTHPIWLDEPIAALTTDALAKIVDGSVMPVGVGRMVSDLAVFQNLLRFGSVNVLRPSLGVNSLTKIKRAAALAESHYVAVAPYHNGGPIGTVAGIHLAAALPNSYAQQVPVPAAERDAAMRAEITSGNHEIGDQGFAALLNRPGLGIEVNERALNAYSEENL